MGNNSQYIIWTNRNGKILCTNMECVRHIPIHIPKFYKDVIKGWFLSGGGNKAPKNANDIRAEIVWKIDSSNQKGRPYSSRHGKKVTLILLMTLDEDGKFISSEELYHKLNKKLRQIGVLNNYNILLKAIPII